MSSQRRPLGTCSLVGSTGEHVRCEGAHESTRMGTCSLPGSTAEHVPGRRDGSPRSGATSRGLRSATRTEPQSPGLAGPDLQWFR